MCHGVPSTTSTYSCMHGKCQSTLLFSERCCSTGCRILLKPVTGSRLLVSCNLPCCSSWECGMQVMTASKTTFQLVSIARGDDLPPVTLLRMCQVSGSIALVLRQVHAALCSDVSLDQFRLTASKQRQAAIKTWEGPDCLWIFKYGATQSHSHRVNVISLATAIGACTAHGLQHVALSSLESLRWPGKYTILEDTRAYPQAQLYS